MNISHIQITKDALFDNIILDETTYLYSTVSYSICVKVCVTSPNCPNCCWYNSDNMRSTIKQIYKKIK